jgi:hypothetical protein
VKVHALESLPLPETQVCSKVVAFAGMDIAQKSAAADLSSV